MLLIETAISSAKEPETKMLEAKESTQQGNVLWKKWQVTKSLRDLTKSVMGEIGGKEDHDLRKDWSEYHIRGYHSCGKISTCFERKILKHILTLKNVTSRVMP